MIRNKIVSVFIGMYLCTGFSCGAIDTLSGLLEDMKHYATTSKHRGDLFQHSVWTGQILGRWMRNTEQPAWAQELVIELTKSLSERERYLLEVAGVVHDIGKAGDLALEKYLDTTRIGDTIYYFSRGNHERIGFEYILHDLPRTQGKYARAYQAVDGAMCNFYALFKRLGITEEEQKLIAILVGAHKTLSIAKRIAPLYEPNIEQIAREVLGEIMALVDEAKYAAGRAHSLVCMSILLQIADIYTTYYPVSTPGAAALFDAQLIVPSPHPYVEDNEKDARMIARLFPKFNMLVRVLLRIHGKAYDERGHVSRG